MITHLFKLHLGSSKSKFYHHLVKLKSTLSNLTQYISERKLPLRSRIIMHIDD